MSPSLKVPRDTGVCRPPICPIRQAGYLPPAGGFYQALLLMLCSFRSLSNHRGPRRALAPGLLGLLGVLPLLASGLCGPPNTGCM